MIGGLQLPWLTTLGKMSTQYAAWLPGPPSALPWFLLGAAIVVMVWKVRRPWAGMREERL
jgi:hypothetical protein